MNRARNMTLALAVLAAVFALAAASFALLWVQERSGSAKAQDQLAGLSERLDQASTQRDEARKVAAETQRRVNELEEQLMRARSILGTAQDKAAQRAAEEAAAEEAAAAAEEAAAAAAEAERQRQATEAADDDTICRTFDDPRDASQFIADHPGAACDMLANGRAYCEYIPPQ